MSLIYFVAGRPTDEKIKELLCHLGNQPLARAEVGNGPNSSGPGYVICPEGQVPRLNQTEQHWEKSGDGKYYIGWWHNAPPTPQNLAKPTTIEGVNHNGWIVPVARTWILEKDSPRYVSSLPAKPRWNGVTFVAGETQERFRPVFELADSVFQKLIALHGPESDGKLSDDALRMASEIISINYWVGPNEFAALGICDYSYSGFVKLLMSFVDFEGFAELLEKKDQPAEQG